MYKKFIDPTEEQVNSLLEKGYTLHSITPIVTVSQYNYTLIYHFIKVPSYLLGVDLSYDAKKPDWNILPNVTCDDSDNPFI